MGKKDRDERDDFDFDISPYLTPAMSRDERQEDTRDTRKKR